MPTSTSRPRQPGASLARREPPRIIEFEPIPASFRPGLPSPFRLDLAKVIDPTALQAMTQRGEMTLHCAGDTGGVKRPEAQSLVARGMERNLQIAKQPAAFCYHVGDLVYYNGEVADYWAQFYEPYEHYPPHILAIPGNHDGELLTRQSTSLLGFYENLIDKPGNYTHESRDSGRAVVGVPWFYWTLLTPFATFVGLYTNVPEHGRLDDAQRAWFHNELAEAPDDRALVIALHHPVYSFDDHHSGSPTMAEELQTAINTTRRVPNMVLSGHVHNYQRIELQTAGHTIPFFVIGNGGYWNLHHLGSPPGYADPETTAKLLAGVDDRHGFMTFDIGRKVINGHFTTVPRPQESWSNPKAFNEQFDVFSYPATPMRLAAGQQVALLPATGSHVASHAGVAAAGDTPAPARRGRRRST
jgi:hypothetical protein